MPALDIDVLPDPVTEQADQLYDLWWFTNWAGLAVALLVWGLVAWCLWRYRWRGDDTLPDQRADNVGLEIGYTLGSLALVVAIFAWTVVVEQDVTDTVEDPDLVVEVIGFNWGWQFRYPETGAYTISAEGRPPVLVLPAERTVRLELQSVDVIHSFFVPDFLAKRDLIPGIENAFDVDVKEPGEWRGACAEFCGLEHYQMRFRVRAVPPEEFERWLATTEEGPVTQALPTLSGESS